MRYLAVSAIWPPGLILGFSTRRSQARIATSTGPFLDLVAFDFLGRYLTRRGANDHIFVAKIKATILQERVTRAGMVNAITQLTGKTLLLFLSPGIRMTPGLISVLAKKPTQLRLHMAFLAAGEACSFLAKYS